MKRRNFLSAMATAGAAFGAAEAWPIGTAAATPAEPRPLPVRMNVGHQHDHSESTLKLLAALGVTHICSKVPSHTYDENWSTEGLTRLRKYVESFGVALDAVPLPLESVPIAKADYPEILLAKDPDRERAMESICQMIRNAGQAGIPMVKYNLTFLGVVRTERTLGRGNASYATFDYDENKPEPLTEAGEIGEDVYWDRITAFLQRVVPVAEEAKVKIALHPQDPGLPKERGYRGVHAVLSSVDGLKRFVQIMPSAYHGLNFCQGTISEMLPKPGEQIYDVIRYFGQRRKIFNVHFRNISGGLLHFRETFPDNGDVDMPRALRTYREVGFDGMIMPDHVPQIEGDPDRYKAFSFCFGYIQALLQVLRSET